MEIDLVFFLVVTNRKTENDETKGRKVTPHRQKERALI